ncbi:MAG: hypothetical protein K9G76_09835 [Bacteroidales bacterium]|nr:hypothetical protein [Bacteroidales bacterium]MCF8403999.1 hypothetical protein [Bacteroidales bacterium]
MKTRLLFLVLGLYSVVSYAQAPQAIKYQAVVRNDVGDFIQDQTVSLRISIHQGSAGGTIVYQETFSVMTNEFGLATIEIGNGTPVTGTFPDISWASDDYFIETELDPDGGSTYTSMGTSQFLSVAYALHAGSSGDSRWDTSGNNIYYNDGKVGIGLTSPEGDFHVAKNTLGHEGLFGTNIGTFPQGSSVSIGNDSDDAVLYLGQSPTNKGYIAWDHNSTPEDGYLSIGGYGGTGNLILQELGGNVGIGTTNPYGKLSILGNIDHEFPTVTVGNALSAWGGTNSSMYEITNTSDNGGGLMAGMISSSTGEYSYGLYGYNNGSGYGVYGINWLHYNQGYLGSNNYGAYGEHGSSDNWGFIGGNNHGVYGEHGSSENWGYLGSFYYGVYGKHVATQNYGYLGGSSYGVYGAHNSGNYAVLGSTTCGLYATNYTTNPGDYAIIGYSWNDAGIGYGVEESLGSVMGEEDGGNSYTFGVAGYSYGGYERCGATFGSIFDGFNWGCLAYQNSGNTEYGGYFTTYTTGIGKDSDVQINNGIGAWGDLFGADIHGKIYGTYTEGNNFALFSNGDNYTNGLDVHLQKDKNGENEVLYTHVSTDATIQTSGYATLNNGESDIAFDKTFADAVSSTAPIIVTVTPVGNSNGVYLSEVSSAGFKIVENNGGKSNVSVNYIAIGKRAGYENPQLPEELINVDFTEKLAIGLHNDGDTESNGEGLYYENGKLYVGTHPSALPDPNRSAREVSSFESQMKPERQKPEDRKYEMKRPEISKLNKTLRLGQAEDNREESEEIRGMVRKVGKAVPKKTSSEKNIPDYKTYHGGLEKK